MQRNAAAGKPIAVACAFVFYMSSWLGRANTFSRHDSGVWFAPNIATQIPDQSIRQFACLSPENKKQRVRLALIRRAVLHSFFNRANKKAGMLGGVVIGRFARYFSHFKHGCGELRVVLTIWGLRELFHAMVWLLRHNNMEMGTC